LLRFAVLAILVYAASAYGWPWLQAKLRGSADTSSVEDDTGNAAATACIAQSVRAFDDFREKVDSLGSSQVELNWREAMRRTRVEIDAARAACRCDAEACVAASNAMTVLTESTQSFEATVLDGGTPRDISAQLERVAALLDTARERVRAGA
jgi:hypothetical protein